MFFLRFQSFWFSCVVTGTISSTLQLILWPFRILKWKFSLPFYILWAYKKDPFGRSLTVQPTTGSTPSGIRSREKKLASSAVGDFRPHTLALTTSRSVVLENKERSFWGMVHLTLYSDGKTIVVHLYSEATWQMLTSALQFTECTIKSQLMQLLSRSSRSPPPSPP